MNNEEQSKMESDDSESKIKFEDFNQLRITKDQYSETLTYINTLENGLLKDFLLSSLSEFEDQMNEAEKLLKTNPSKNEEKWVINVILENGEKAHIGFISPESTMSEFLEMFKEFTGITTISLNQLQRVVPSSSAVSFNPSHTLRESNIDNRDSLRVVPSTVSHSSVTTSIPSQNNKVLRTFSPQVENLLSTLQKLRNPPVRCRTPLQLIMLFCHTILASECGFQPIYSIPPEGEEKKKNSKNQVAGFAPPVRSIPPSKLVEEDWNEDSDCVSFQYKCASSSSSKKKPKKRKFGRGKRYILTGILLEEDVLIHFGPVPSNDINNNNNQKTMDEEDEEDQEPVSTSLTLSEYLDFDALGQEEDGGKVEEGDEVTCGVDDLRLGLMNGDEVVDRMKLLVLGDDNEEEEEEENEEDQNLNHQYSSSSFDPDFSTNNQEPPPNHHPIPLIPIIGV